jgi:hypothetical protein
LASATCRQTLDRILSLEGRVKRRKKSMQLEEERTGGKKI